MVKMRRRVSGSLLSIAPNSRTDFEISFALGPLDEAIKVAGKTRGFIALLSKKTWRTEGARWEMRCAAEEGIWAIGVHVLIDDKGAIPP
jgi:hypothetical protein